MQKGEFVIKYDLNKTENVFFWQYKMMRSLLLTWYPIDLIFELAQLIVKMSCVYVNYSKSLILSSLQSWIEVLDIYLILKKHPSKKLLVKAGSSNFFILLINQIFLQGMRDRTFCIFYVMFNLGCLFGTTGYILFT